MSQRDPPRDGLRAAQAEFAAADAETRRHDQAVDHLAEIVARRRKDVEVASEDRRVTAMTVAEVAAQDPSAIPRVRVDEGQLLHAQSQLDLAVASHRAAAHNLSVATRARVAAAARVRAAAASVAIAHAEKLASALETIEQEALAIRLELIGAVTALGGRGISVPQAVNDIARRSPSDPHLINSPEQKKHHAVARGVRQWLDELETNPDAELREPPAEARTLPSWITNRPASLTTGG